jgi:hypothetical protein
MPLDEAVAEKMGKRSLDLDSVFTSKPHSFATRNAIADTG